MSSVPQNDWLLWQLADSAFPTGGFAHSGGVEAAFQHRELCTREELIAFLQAALAQSASGSLPFSSAAFDGIEPFRKIDSLCDAFTSNHVANRASRLQGRAFINSAERTFSIAEITALRQELHSSESPSHFAPVFGSISRLLGLERAAALRLFLFTQVRGWISSAVRLGIVGPIAAQSIQTQIAALAEGIVRRCGDLTLDDVAQTAPLIDLFQGTQDRLYSRLFQS